MYIKLKENETFTIEKFNLPVSELCGGMCNLSLDIRNWILIFEFDFYATAQTLAEVKTGNPNNKKPIYDYRLIIRDSNEGDELTEFIASQIGLDGMSINERAIYTKLLSLTEFEDFELIEDV